MVNGGGLARTFKKGKEMNEPVNPNAPDGKVAPPNPFHQREYVTSTEDGYASLRISAPGGKVSSVDAADLISWLELIITQLKRDRDDTGEVETP